MTCSSKTFSLYFCVTEGHLPSTCRMWNGYADRGNHRESVLPGERCLAEQMQGPGSRENLCGGDGLNPGQGR